MLTNENSVKISAVMGIYTVFFLLVSGGMIEAALTNAGMWLTLLKQFLLFFFLKLLRENILKTTAQYVKRTRSNKINNNVKALQKVTFQCKKIC